MGIVTVLDGIVAKLVADEIKAWLPHVSEQLLHCAVAWLPGEEAQERYKEEWAADLLEIPGDISRLMYALGLMRGSLAIVLQQTTFASIRRRLLWKTGFLDFDVTEWADVEWEEKKEGSELLRGTVKLDVRPIPLREWLARRRRSKDAQKTLTVGAVIRRSQTKYPDADSVTVRITISPADD